MAITFNSFDIDDNTNFVVTRVDGDRSSPERALEEVDIARREGAKFLGEEYKKKIITIEGAVFADTVSGFRTIIDNLKQNLSGSQKALVLSSDRTYTATVSRLEISETENAVTYGQFRIEFIVTNPFALGTQQSVSLTVTSGITTLSGTVTISGTAFARPVITYTPPTATGDTPVTKIVITHTPTGEVITWSGVGNNLYVEYGSSLAFNFDNLTVLQGSTERDWTGIFARWEPGSNAFTVTFSGAAIGGTVDFTYDPRYL